MWAGWYRGPSLTRRVAILPDSSARKETSTRFVSLLPASSFVVLAATGTLAFVRPFSIGAVGLPCCLLIEIDQPGDDQPSLVYFVEIDNADPRAFQLLDLAGYPKREENDETW